MDLKTQLIKLLGNFKKQSFKDVEVDGTIYRLSTEAIEVGTEVKLVTMDEEGNEIETPVEDNTWTIEGITFKTEGGVIVEIMEEEAVVSEELVSVDEVLFSEEDIMQILTILETVVTDMEMLKAKIAEMEGTVDSQEELMSKQNEEIAKISTEFNKKPSNNGVARLAKTKENNGDLATYTEIARKYINK
jgi:hypothetical protein